MIKFGTGGWRAEIGKDFTMMNIQKVAQGLSDYMKKRHEDYKPVVIGYDRRFLSDIAARWLAEIFSANGITVLFMRRSSPTPLVMHITKKQNLFYGLEVTASHNPPMYNGIKVIVKEGRDAPIEITDELEVIMNNLTEEKILCHSFEQGLADGTIQYLENPFNEFLDDILNLLDTDAIRNRGLRILFDPMHGSATYPLMVLFYTTRCTVDLINSNKDAYFGGMMPAPTEYTLNELSMRVKDGGYDLGIGVDGDGDRLGIIDGKGRYINANEILVLLYYYLHEYKGWKGPVVRNLATTHMLDKLARDLGEVCYEVPVGFKYISQKIDEEDAVLGGESSGGLTVRGHIHGKDSIYAAALFVEMVCKTGKEPADILKELEKKYGIFRMVEANLHFPVEDKAAINHTMMVQRCLPDFGHEIEKVNYEDGCKVYFKDDSFVICRFSGTEPLLRIFAEASDTDTASRYIEAWRKLLDL